MSLLNERFELLKDSNFYRETSLAGVIIPYCLTSGDEASSGYAHFKDIDTTSLEFEEFILPRIGEDNYRVFVSEKIVPEIAQDLVAETEYSYLAFVPTQIELDSDRIFFDDIRTLNPTLSKIPYYNGEILRAVQNLPSQDLPEYIDFFKTDRFPSFLKEKEYAMENIALWKTFDKYPAPIMSLFSDHYLL